VPLYVWIALGIFLIGLVGGLIWAGVRGRSAWTRARPAVRRMTAASNELTVRTTALEQRMARLELKATELQRDAERLGISVARARVLFRAASDAKRLLDGALAFVPRA
jgi:hypothetical protein